MSDPKVGAEKPSPPDHNHWLVRPRTIAALWIGFVIVLVLTLVPDLLIDHHAEFEIEGTIGFGAWFGFLSCLVLVFGSLALGCILKRRDSYYDR